MGKELAIDVLRQSDPATMRMLLQQRKKEMDDAFSDYLLGVSTQYQSTRQYDEAVKALRALFLAGESKGDAYMRAYAHWRVAEVEVERGRFDVAIKRLLDVLQHSEQAAGKNALTLRAVAATEAARLYAGEQNNVSEAKRLYQQAVALYRQLGEAQQVTYVEGLLNALQQQPTQAQPVRFSAISSQLEKLQNVQAELAQSEQQLAQMQAQKMQLEQQYANVHEAYQNALAQQEQATERAAHLQERIQEMRREGSTIKKQLALLAQAQDVPLWAAAVRADIDRGEISDLTLPLLEHLQKSIPSQAAPFVAEVRARNGLAPNVLLPVEGLSGEARLFAGVANAHLLEQHDSIQAAEALLDAWETYLQSAVGSSQ